MDNTRRARSAPRAAASTDSIPHFEFEDAHSVDSAGDAHRSSVNDYLLPSARSSWLSAPGMPGSSSNMLRPTALGIHTSRSRSRSRSRSGSHSSGGISQSSGVSVPGSPGRFTDALSEHMSSSRSNYEDAVDYDDSYIANVAEDVSELKKDLKDALGDGDNQVGSWLAAPSLKAATKSNNSSKASLIPGEETYELQEMPTRSPNRSALHLEIPQTTEQPQYSPRPDTVEGVFREFTTKINNIRQQRSPNPKRQAQESFSPYGDETLSFGPPARSVISHDQSSTLEPQAQAHPLILYGKSLKIFPPYSELRNKVAQRLENPLYNYGIKIMLLLQTIVLSYRQWNPSALHGYIEFGASWADWLLLAINIIYTAEILAKCVAWGFWDDSEMFKAMDMHYTPLTRMLKLQSLRSYFLGEDSDTEEYKNTFKHSMTFKSTKSSNSPMRRAFMRSSWNRVDFISTVCFWINFFLSVKRTNVAHHIPLFRALECLRIIRLVNLTDRISLILKSIKHGAPQLTDVVLFILYFWTLFAIIGTQSFKSSYRRYCVWTDPNDPSNTYQSDQHCGGYLVQNSNGSLSEMPYIGIEGSSSPYAKGYLCPVNSVCVVLENPENNMYSFDNILNAMQLTFVVMSANTFSNIMYDMMNTDTMAASVYFIFGIFVLFLWMINLLVAVINAAFRAIRESEIKEEGDFKEDFDLSFNLPDWWLSKLYGYILPLMDNLTLACVTVACLRDKSSTTTDIQEEDRAQYIISWAFCVEIIWRFACYRREWKKFFKVRRNLFDGFLVIATCVMLTPSVHTQLGRGFDWMMAFVALRFYRFVLRIPFVRKLWAKVWRNINIILNLSLFYFLFLFLCGIIFARYWEGVIPPDEIDDNQFPMNTLPNTLLALFVITTTENWTDIMFGMQSAAANKTSALFGALLFIGWFIFSNSIILSIFIAVIGDSLEVSEKVKRKAQVKKFILVDFPKKLKQLAEGTVLQDIRDRFFGSGDAQEQKHREIEKLLLNGAAVEAFLRDEMEQEVIDELDEADDDIHTLSRNAFLRYFQIRYRHARHWMVVQVLRKIALWYTYGGKQNPFFSKSKFSPDSNYAALAEKFQIETEKTIEARKKFLKENPSFNTALYILRPNQPLRKLCQYITKPSFGKRYDGVEPNKLVNSLFVGFIAAATLALVIIACYNTPLYRNADGFSADSKMWNWTLTVEANFGVVFALEFLIKIIADGLWYTPNAYFRNSWNIIDMIVLNSIWINIFAIVRGDESLSRVVRGMKALRALRILTISETSKDIFQKVLIAGVRKILSAALLSFLLILPFAAWGLHMFTGRLGACNDNSMGLEDCVSEFSTTVFKWDIMMPRSYIEPQLELNRFASALLTLFEILSMEGWTDLLQNVVNSTGVGTPIGYYATPVNAVFVVLFLFVGIVFVLTLFISVIIKNYAMLSGSAFLTLQQTSWNEVNKLLSQARPRKRPDTRSLNSFRMFCYRYSIDKPRWLRATMHVILWIHVLAIMLEKFPTIDGLDNFRYAVFICSSTFFLGTILMRLVALGPRTFFKVRWNIYEFFVFLGAFGTSFASFFVSRSTSFANVNQLFLVGIFTVLIYQSNRLSHLLKIASASLPSLLSLMFTWGILLLVYAIALNQVFGLTRLGPNTDNNQNLRTVTKSMILLFKISFGENWNYTMRDFAVESPYCVDSGQFASTDCGNMQYAYILFISWNILSMYIFVNMFVSLIFENFSYVYTDNDGSTTLTREEIRMFKTVWAKFDPDGTGYISEEQLPCLLRSLTGYFSFHMFEGRWSVEQLVENYIGTREVEGQEGPYDIDVDIHGLNRLLSHLDVEKARERRMKYERFIEEAKFNMERNKEHGISFQRLIVQIPLYARFDENNCLTLTDFLDRLVVSRKLNERLEYRRRLDTLKMISCRWRYLRSTGRKFASVTPNFQRPNLFNEMDEIKSPFIRPNPFMTPRSSISKRSETNEAYWSPAESDPHVARTGTDVLEELASISGALEHSQWRQEFKSLGHEFDDVISKNEIDDDVGERKGKGDSSSDDAEIDSYEFVLDDDYKGHQSDRKIT